jgi:hypothetical protein
MSVPAFYLAGPAIEPTDPMAWFSSPCRHLRQSKSSYQQWNLWASVINLRIGRNVRARTNISALYAWRIWNQLVRSECWEIAITRSIKHVSINGSTQARWFVLYVEPSYYQQRTREFGCFWEYFHYIQINRSA